MREGVEDEVERCRDERERNDSVSLFHVFASRGRYGMEREGSFSLPAVDSRLEGGGIAGE